jgi:hypothetical protein
LVHESILHRRAGAGIGHGGTHIDIKFGLKNHGPLDAGEETAPTHLRVGLVGTEETIDSVKTWFKRCRTEVAAKTRRKRQPNLFPRFPGFSTDSPFLASVVFHDRWCSAIRQREGDATNPVGTGARPSPSRTPGAGSGPGP